MSRDLINRICAGFPKSEVSDPWGGGHDVWKVGGKMFAAIGSVTPGVSVKCDSVEQAEMLIDAGIGTKARYFHRSWITLPFETEPAELDHRLRASYLLIRNALPKKLRAEIPELD